jgi:hypothetical protein
VQAFGYLLRKLPEKSLPETVRHVLAESAATASKGRVHGAAYLLAESILGPAHGLHSCATAVLDAVLAQGLLQDSTRGDGDAGAQLTHTSGAPCEVLMASLEHCSR